jgi:hypothetical protein
LNPSTDLRHALHDDQHQMIIHPETDTGLKRFGYTGFKRKFLFLCFDIPSMPNTGGFAVFRYAAKAGLKSSRARRQAISIRYGRMKNRSIRNRMPLHRTIQAK